MPGQLSTSIGSGVGLQQQNIGENVGRANEKGTGAAPIRMAAGKKWRDESLLEWPENDYRLFVGNLDKETKLEQLEKVFTHYCSFAKAKLVMNNFPEKGTNRYMCKGYGFVRAGRNPLWTDQMLEQFDDITTKNPSVKLHTMANVGHWLHVEDVKGLVGLLTSKSA